MELVSVSGQAPPQGYFSQPEFQDHVWFMRAASQSPSFIPPSVEAGGSGWAALPSRETELQVESDVNGNPCSLRKLEGDLDAERGRGSGST